MKYAKYVGLKPQETDCVAGTGITWIGFGAVQPVPDAAWEIMRNHPDVWELDAESAPVPTPVSGLGLADSLPCVLDTIDTIAAQMPSIDLTDKAALRALATERGVQVHPNAKAETFVERLRAAGVLTQPTPTA